MNMPTEIRDFLAAVDALVVFTEIQLEAAALEASTRIVVREDLARHKRTREAFVNYFQASAE